jgi:hypothetical protein
LARKDEEERGNTGKSAASGEFGAGQKETEDREDFREKARGK